MIAIVTDSTAPVTRQEAEDLGVCVVSHSYLANGTAYLENYEDRNFNYPSDL
jgi:fatty acid-binding protein DegV